MSNPATEVFKVSWRSPLVIVASAFFALPLVVLGSWGIPLVLASGGVWLDVTLLIPAVTLRNEGLVLYCFNDLLWQQITAVRSSKVLGLPYLVVTRHKGLRWWVPLYVVGKRPILAALADRAPIGNALQAFAVAAASNNSFNPKRLRRSG